MNSPDLYPFRFEPILKSKIWGGSKLASILGKGSDSLEQCGESWEISTVGNDVSVVAEGPLAGQNLVDLIAGYKEQLVGQKIFEKFGTIFPLLIKYIDARTDLSIQVHPNDALAWKKHKSFGKTEMWYTIDAEPGATLIAGFNKPTNRKEYLEYFNLGRLPDLLNKEEVQRDDVFFLPAGRVHTIGKGLLIAEIQQTSDITYRIFDYDRIDKDGKKRELHVDLALDAIDFTFYDSYKTKYNHNAPESELVSCPYFITRRLIIHDVQIRDYKALDSFVVLMVVAGTGLLEVESKTIPFTIGQTFLIPASINRIVLKPTEKTTLLEVGIP